MSNVSLHFLGAPRIERDGKPIEPDTRKALALAAYLALTGTAHHRDELAALFYPDADQAHARAALRRTLSALKSALGENALDIDRETVALPMNSNVRVDVLEFRRLIQQNDRASLTRAVQLYQGDFLSGFTLRDSPAFDEWQFFETESLRKQLAVALEQLVTLYRDTHETERGAYKHAIEYARRWLALDPLHEPAHRALMELYARDGHRAAALRQYRECLRLLDQELGVAPLPETVELYRRIEENRLPTASVISNKVAMHRITEILSLPSSVLRPPSSSTASRLLPTAYSPSYPLVGRSAELASLFQAYESIDRAGRLLVIQGEAGIGKTRLAQEFLDTLAQSGAEILTAACYVEQRALAYAPMVQTLRGALTNPNNTTRLASLPPSTLSDAARLLPELEPSALTTSPEGPGSQARFFDAVTQVILALTHNGNPGVLFLDDAQWLDDASLDLLAFLIRRLRTAPLCILFTWRTEEVGNDHALRRLYADALREQRALLISLPRLERSQVQTLVDAAAERGAPITPALADQLYTDSEGQPFFLIESLKLLEREGALPDGTANLPASVRELLHSRLSRASETARQLLGAAAIIGRSFDFEIVRAASGRSEEETITGLEELVAQGLILEVIRGGAPQYDFTHEKLRALVYEETSLARRRLLHRRTAEALTQRARTAAALDASAGQIAQHYRAGGSDALAAEFYKRAGDYSRSVFANRDAVEHYTAALALGYPDAAELHAGIGDAQTLLGEYDAALHSYETSAAFGTPDADAKIARVYLRRGEWQRSARYLQNALASTDDPATQARLYADLALAAHHLGDSPEANKYAQRALKLAKSAHDNRALAQAHNIRGILARTRGEWDTARKHLEQSSALADQLRDPGAYAAALNNLALVLHATGDDLRALELSQRALELVTREGDRHRQAALHNHLADLYHALGRDPESMQHLKAAVAIYTEIGGEPGAWQPEIWKLEEW
ncbi:MAG TPA: AAA family ATPase [Anaerolineae bacterium]|nr:AAA family ATPase [Anaerolineae bacterium]